MLVDPAGAGTFSGSFRVGTPPAEKDGSKLSDADKDEIMRKVKPEIEILKAVIRMKEKAKEQKELKNELPRLKLLHSGFSPTLLHADVALTVPRRVIAGSPVEFSATMSTLLESRVRSARFQWVAPDGVHTGARVRLRFAEPGTAVVRVTASDATGNSVTITKEIVVSAKD